MVDLTSLGAGATFRLIYRSRPRIADSDRDEALAAIFYIARRNNVARGITGALLAWEDAFVQLLEGDEGEVRSVYARILVDPRHDDVVMLEATTVAERTFPRWSMGRISDQHDDDVPVRRDRQAGRHPAPTPPPDDARQQMMLDLMRDYARPDVQPR